LFTFREFILILLNFNVESCYIFGTSNFSGVFNFYDYVLFFGFPAIIYVNADTQKVQILKDNKGRSGVYMWTNNINGKRYVGSSINLGKRLSSYYNFDFLSKPQHKMLIYKALLKYGYSQFKFEILEYCDPSKLIEREQYYIDLLKPEYNVLKIAGSSLGAKHSEEAKAKIADALKGDNNPMYGKKRVHSLETLAKISEVNKGKARAEGAGRLAERISVLDLETNISTEYDSISSAAIAVGISKSRISMYFIRNQNKPFKGRYVFKKL
jgi:group I intron endonuclease